MNTDGLTIEKRMAAKGGRGGGRRKEWRMKKEWRKKALGVEEG